MTELRKCGHPLGTTRWCPECELEGAGRRARMIEDFASRYASRDDFGQIIFPGDRWPMFLADLSTEHSLAVIEPQGLEQPLALAAPMPQAEPQEASKPEVGGMNEYDLLEDWMDAAGICFDGVGDCATTGPVRRMDILQLIRVARDLKLDASKEASKVEPVAVGPVGTLTISKFRGHLENQDFDYFGALPEGTHNLYAHPSPQALSEGSGND